FDPDDGVVRLGGVDVRSVSLAAVRERIGLVSQEVHLFSASIRDNITLFDDTVSDDRITAVLANLGLGGWLEGLPEGLNTYLKQETGGTGLSAGQAQVLACARVLLHDRDVVILDEASSRLDPATERLVHAALGRLLEGRTGIIVAHRLSTVAYADDIMVLENGQVREHGPRLELAADPGSQFSQLLRFAGGGVVS
ncbi:MAG: ATP-binding cassette domain-containing protein, partial [Thermomicrobiales bacterium]